MKFLNPKRELIEGMEKTLILDLANAIGANGISGTPSVESTGLTFSTPSVSGTQITTTVSGGEAGRDYVCTVTAELSSGETEVGAFILEWKAPGYDCRAGRR